MLFIGQGLETTHDFSIQIIDRRLICVLNRLHNNDLTVSKPPKNSSYSLNYNYIIMTITVFIIKWRNPIK